MPELPEVERAAKLTRHVALGRTIEQVESFEDTIVYTGGITHEEFAKEITGRKVTGVGRYGKVFYIELEGKGRMPVLHLGMTGMIQIKGEEPTRYRRRNKDLAAGIWPPPKFLKFILHFSSLDGSPGTELAFIDPRRLARIRLAHNPTQEPPISELGFDPILCMPEYDEFSKSVLKRTCPIKALLLDQSFSAGVGNWVADEILYQAKIHPEQRASNLSDEQVRVMYDWTKKVCEIAVSVDADSTRFPEDWLFRYRWGKGQKSTESMILPSGEKAKIEWLTVGGRTSAVVAQVQKMPTGGRTVKRKAVRTDNAADSPKPAPTKGRKRKAKRTEDDALPAETNDDESDLTPVESDGEKDASAKANVVRRSTRIKTVEVKEQASGVRATKRQKTTAVQVSTRKTRTTKALK